MSKSKFIVMLPSGQKKTKTDWEDLEIKMIEKYMDDLREVQRLQELEESESSDLVYVVESTR